MQEGFSFIALYLEEFTYAGIFLTLILAGFGLPFPEEVILILSGYLAFLKYTKFLATILIALLGVLIGDIVLFYFGRKWGKLVLNHHRLTWLFTKKRLARARIFFRKYGKRTIFMARFLSGIRAPVYLTAGTMGMKGKNFLLMDALAAIINVPFFVFLGFFFGDDIDKVLKVLRRTEYVLLGIVFIIGIILYIKLKRKVREENG